MRVSELDPVLQAAATAFGFVYIHPFQDGNARVHRCLIHHVLAERQFTPLEAVEMPDRLAQDLIMFIRQNGGKLSKRRHEKEFAALTDDEVLQIEGICNEVFGDDQGTR